MVETFPDPDTQTGYEAVRASEYDSVDKASGPDALTGLLNRLSGNSAGSFPIGLPESKDDPSYTWAPVSTDLRGDDLYHAVIKQPRLGGTLRDASGQVVGRVLETGIWPSEQETDDGLVPAHSLWVGTQWTPAAVADGDPPAVRFGVDGLRATS